MLNYLKSIKKIVVVIALTGLICPTAYGMLSHKEEKKEGLLNTLLQTCGTIYAGTFVHELGHLIVGKKVYDCKGIFWINPINFGGGTLFYYGPSPIKIVYQLLKSYPTIPNISITQPSLSGIKGASVYVAGPLAGLCYALLMPVANTFWNKYKAEDSLSLAIKKTMSEPYFNESQNFGLIAGSIGFGAGNILNILPTFKGCDGMGILDCLKINKRIIRIPLLMMPFVLVGAYLKNESK